ncbi:MAG: RES domain-containing protein [Cytophagales bacterium]|nr:RES domain-containing protein [Cytophagales bacterium]
MAEPLTNKAIEEFFRLVSKHASAGNHISYTYIRRTLEKLSIPFPSVTVPKGRLLCRSRAHTKGEDFFRNIEDISYRQDLFYIEDFGRANEPTQSIFYCSDSDVVAFVETSILTRQNSGLPSDTITTGVWEVQEDFQIATIISNDEIRGLNSTMEGLETEFRKLAEVYRNEGTDGHINILDLFSKEFTRNSHGDNTKYIVSCAFANYVYEAINQNNLQVGGIMYPSAIYTDEGMNLALKPELIYSGKLKLIVARRGTMNKRDETNYHEEDIIDAKSINHDTSTIEW